MNDPLGWDYPAGAENDPDAPWNQKDDAPDDERDMDDASDEECGNLTSPSALAADFGRAASLFRQNASQVPLAGSFQAECAI